MPQATKVELVCGRDGPLDAAPIQPGLRNMQGCVSGCLGEIRIRSLTSYGPLDAPPIQPGLRNMKYECRIRVLRLDSARRLNPDRQNQTQNLHELGIMVGSGLW